MHARPEIDPDGLRGRIVGLPGFDAIRAAAAESGVRAWLVGGAVRDALLGIERADLDVVVDGDHLALVRALGGEARTHERFGTATVAHRDWEIDVARARAEAYEAPGALPRVRPAGLAEDLARRDFSINAIAIPLDDPGRPIDPHSGADDLDAGLLRALHPRSLADDPTRALRAARYAARLGLEVESATLAQIRGADLDTVSVDRVAAELQKLAAEPAPRQGFELLSEWGLFALADRAGELIDRVSRLLGTAPWADLAGVPETVLALLDPDAVARARELAEWTPGSPSAAVSAARGRSGAELALARALGGGWLDSYVAEWRGVALDIGGDDLLAAGVPEGERIGRGLTAALRAKLDGQTRSRKDELEVALEAAGSG